MRASTHCPRATLAGTISFELRQTSVFRKVKIDLVLLLPKMSVDSLDSFMNEAFRVETQNDALVIVFSYSSASFKAYGPVFQMRIDSKL